MGQFLKKRSTDFFSHYALEQPWPTQIGSRATILKNRHFEGRGLAMAALECGGGPESIPTGSRKTLFQIEISVLKRTVPESFKVAQFLLRTSRFDHVLVAIKNRLPQI